jgi:murein DD-endopeptidase MepM/ murein hydrolase activator NlpD
MTTRSRLHHLLVTVALATMAFLVALPPPGAAGIDDPAAAEPDATVYSPSFSDVPEGHKFEPSVRALLAAGITVGCNPPANDRYCPDSAVTRGQMAAFLTRGLGLQAGNGTDFTDDDNSVFQDDIERLAHAGITRGCNPPANDRYCPDRPITRGEMAAFLTRALALSAPPAIPDGVSLQREPVAGAQRGARLTVCREVEVSLVVRSVTADPLGPGRWAPTTLTVSIGEPDLATDRWFLPASTGCETLEAAWSPRGVELAAPLATFEVVSHFGPRLHPILGGLRPHNGTDLRARTGDPVFASAPGVVVSAGTRGGYGTMVEVRHVGGLDTRYAHLSSMAVSVGDQVTTGDLLGAVGCTGLCTGPHLHFETLEFGTAVDPMTYLSTP